MVVAIKPACDDDDDEATVALLAADVFWTKEDLIILFDAPLLKFLNNMMTYEMVNEWKMVVVVVGVVVLLGCVVGCCVVLWVECGLFVLFFKNTGV